MDNLLLVPGEVVGVEISSLHQLSMKKKAKLTRFQVAKDNVKFLPCLYMGQTKKGVHKIAPASATPAEGGGTVFAPLGLIIKVRPEHAEEVFERYWGVVHGTIDSLPALIPVPGVPNVGVKIRTSADKDVKFTSNIEKNIRAVSSHAKNDSHMRALIYGPPSSGKTTLADTLASKSGYPWVVVSPKWLTIGGHGAMNAMAFIMALAEQRQFAVLFDDIDELLGLMSGGGDGEDEEGGGGALALTTYYFILEAIKNHPMPLIFTAVGRFPIDHIISQCNVFFSLHFSQDDLKQIWGELCPTAKELADDITEENLPLAMLLALVKQAGMIAKLNKRKTPTKDDVKTALTCFGRREETKPGFGRS